MSERLLVTPDLEALGPWIDMQTFVELGPDGLIQAWSGRLYSVQRYGVAKRAGWDRLHVQRHDGRAVRNWGHLQTLKGLLPAGDRRLAVEVYPRLERVVDLVHAYHLWVLPLNDPLERTFDLAEELSRAVPPAPWTRLA